MSTLAEGKPQHAGAEIDAILYWVQTRYKTSLKGEANLGKFIIRKLKVKFTDEVNELQTRRDVDEQTYWILSPPPPDGQEQSRRAELLGVFSESFIAVQREAIRQLRKMIEPLLDDQGYKALVGKYQEHLQADENKS